MATNKSNQKIFLQAMARKLRIYADNEHPYTDRPDVVKFEMPPRNLRNKGVLLELPEGFEPFNPEAYNKRFGHRLAKLKAQREEAA